MFKLTSDSLSTIKQKADLDWLDFSSLSQFWRCPRSYQWRYEWNITTAGEKASLINGEAYHEAKATYLKLHRLERVSHEDAVETALKAMIPIMKRITEEDAKRNISVAFSTMNNYFNFWKDEEYTTEQVEVGFAVDMNEFLYVGRIDAIKRHPVFGLLVEETKTTSIVGKKWPERTNPNAQIDGYCFAIEAITGQAPSGGILDIIPVTDKLNQPPFRYIAPRTKEDINCWLFDLEDWYYKLNGCRLSGWFPRNTENCTPILGFDCEFKLLCRTYPAGPKEGIAIPAEYCVEPWAPFDELKRAQPHEVEIK